jgi:hypothetical protein
MGPGIHERHGSAIVDGRDKPGHDDYIDLDELSR